MLVTATAIGPHALSSPAAEYREASQYESQREPSLSMAPIVERLDREIDDYRPVWRVEVNLGTGAFLKREIELNASIRDEIEAVAKRLQSDSLFLSIYANTEIEPLRW